MNSINGAVFCCQHNCVTNSPQRDHCSTFPPKKLSLNDSIDGHAPCFFLNKQNNKIFSLYLTVTCTYFL